MTARRVYLFADFGKGPVTLPGRKAAPAYMPVRVVGQTGNQYSERARAWWLVECASAADGRKTIARQRFTHDPHQHDQHGRILASGGSQ